MKFDRSHQKLFCKKGALRCIFAWEFEAFGIVQSRGTLTKLGALLKVSLLAWDIEVFWIIIWRTNSKQPGKIRYCILIKIYIFSWDNMALLCAISLLPDKNALFFSTLQEQSSQARNQRGGGGRSPLPFLKNWKKVP